MTGESIEFSFVRINFEITQKLSTLIKIHIFSLFSILMRESPQVTFRVWIETSLILQDLLRLEEA
jgi:hypothetical protein